MELAENSDMQRLIESVAEMLGVTRAVLSTNAVVQPEKSEPPLDSTKALSSLVRSVLINTVGMGIELP